MLIPNAMSVIPFVSKSGVGKSTIGVKSQTFSVLVLNVIIAISTLLHANGSAERLSLNRRIPSHRFRTGSPVIDPEVSSNRAHAICGSPIPTIF